MKNQHKPKKQEMTSEYLFDDLVTLFESAIPGHGKSRAAQALLDLQNLIDLRIGEAIKGKTLPPPPASGETDVFDLLIDKKLASTKAELIKTIEETLADTGADIEKRIRTIAVEELEKLTNPPVEDPKEETEKNTATKKDAK